ncbi:serine/threonine-protein kinase RIO2-like protein [Leptotrombidium deliense]|uniref:Serine/threonine-protein kinase RIO2 n=1 Tax=Leptotrombidium deliense TaxID=299467 RepID=A0A443SAH6_9ACAR|nr:serine/threonine-protein kinase RIO2-like protein [Leptotrombidium deliense]
MVKLDVSLLRYLTVEEFRVLTAVEMGMKNHEVVPVSLVSTISSLRSGVSKILHQLCQHKLVSYESGKRFDGYRLTYKGYDYLSLNVLRNRGIVSEIGTQIGVGKESDVYLAMNGSGERVVIKIHRLGRVCFRRVNDKRDYQKNGNKVHSFLYLSRLAAKREFSFLEALYERGFAVPKPFDCNRHCVVMQLIDGTLLNNLSTEDIENVPLLYDKLMNLIIQLANDCGVVHGDINEFNIMIDRNNEPILIDFPQMISVGHVLADEYFTRDVNCVVDFFKRKCNYVSDYIPSLSKDVKIENNNVIKVCNEDEMTIWKDTNDSERESKSIELHETIEPLAISTENCEPYLLEAHVSNLKLELDKQSDGDSSSEAAISVSVATTFSSEDVRRKIRMEREKKMNKSNVKNATRKVKGAANVVSRERRNNYHRIKEDCDVHKHEPF